LAGIAVSWAALPLICAMYAQAQSKPTRGSNPEARHLRGLTLADYPEKAASR
jgi:hypothetical protein